MPIFPVDSARSVTNLGLLADPGLPIGCTWIGEWAPSRLFIFGGTDNTRVMAGEGSDILGRPDHSRERRGLIGLRKILPCSLIGLYLAHFAYWLLSYIPEGAFPKQFFCAFMWVFQNSHREVVEQIWASRHPHL